MAAPHDIEALIARVALGERAAFGALYDATSAKLMGICLRVLDDRSAAEDALQDTFVKIWKHADRYAVNGLSPMSWLAAIARNTAIDRLRARRESAGTGIDFDLLPSGARSPEADAIAASEVGRIVACLGELDPDRRDAVKGAYLGGLSYADLAEKFGVPVNTMRTWLRRSLLALRECMAR